MAGAIRLSPPIASASRLLPGVPIVPLPEEFGRSRRKGSPAVSIDLLLVGFGGSFAAAPMERFGVRRVAIGATVAAAPSQREPAATVLRIAPVAPHPIPSAAPT